MNKNEQNSIQLVDLFCGAGGFSLGAHQAGFDVAIAVDNDPVLSSSYSINFPKTKLLQSDVSTLNGQILVDSVDAEIDGIFGGPPCQGFSDIGRRDVADPRRELLGHFFRIIAEIKPKFFVMENVRGLMYSNSNAILFRALESVSSDYAITGPIILDAADFGAATKRRRIFVIGIRKDLGIKISESVIDLYMQPATSVYDAISDLSGANFLYDEHGYDTWKLQESGRVSEYATKLRSDDEIFTGHRLTAHTESVVRRFELVKPGGIDKIGRHPRLTWEGQCPTLRAGTGSDKGSYQSVRPIHPEENRVITIREAARLQGFPDSHKFHTTVWHSFRMIGNSVSPIIAKAIFGCIRDAIFQRDSAAIAAE